MCNQIWHDISGAPKDKRIMVCKRGFKEPWIVKWRDGKRKQGWEASHGFIGFEPEFYTEFPECPQ